MWVFFNHQDWHDAAQSRLGQDFANSQKPVVVIGNFDGMHLGHQALFALARRLADARNAQVIALSFWPHPARVLAPPGSPPLPLIQSRTRRREMLAECGVDALIEQPFDNAFAALPASQFVDEVLLSSLQARDVVIGHDFTFGQGRAGTTDMLKALLGAHGATAHVVPAVTVLDLETRQPIVCSSTFVRKEVRAGRLEPAALVLGRDVELEGTVVRGAGRGRGLGFPTANLDCQAELRPAIGIYAGWAEILRESQNKEQDALPHLPLRTQIWPRQIAERHPTAVSVGYNPTFINGDPALSPVTIEAHLIQPRALTSAVVSPLPSFYGKTVRLHLKTRLRDEQRFSSVQALVAQIHCDIEKTKQLLQVVW